MKVHQISIILDILMALWKKLWDPPGDAPQALCEFFRQGHQDIQNYQYLVYFHLALTRLRMLSKKI